MSISNPRSQQVLKYILSSTESSIAKIESIVVEVVREYGVSDARSADILVSLTEAVNNAIRHGNCLDVNKRVLVMCFVENQDLHLMISDEGIGFSPDGVPNPTRADCLHKNGGRGIHLMKHLADDIKYKDNGSCVHLVFFLT